MADKVSAEEAYYVVLRTVVAGKQTNWAIMAHMQQLRQIMGLSDDLHKQYMEQIQADPEVCALTGTQPPALKRQKTAASAALATAAPPALQRTKSKSRGRTSETGYTAPVIPDYGVPRRIAPHEDPHLLVGMKVNIIQEDDSTVEGMVVNYDPNTNQHFVVVGLNTPDQAGDEVPLAEYPDAYQNLGPHPEYVSPYPAPAGPVSMPPPAARPRQPSYSGAGGPGRGQKHRKVPAARAAGPAAAGTGAVAAAGTTGVSRLGQPPFNQTALEARLPQADLPELQNLLAAISRKERAIMAELDQAGLLDEELSRSVMDREELIRQICAH